MTNEMTIALTRKSFNRPVKYIFAFAVVVALMTLQPQSARAQCEKPGLSAAAAAALVASQAAAVTAATATITAAAEAERMIANAVIGVALNAGWTRIQVRLNQFWEDWLQAMKDQTAQLHAGQVDQIRQMTANYDSSGMGEVAKRTQRAEYESKKQHVVTDEACRFDTTAKYLTRNLQLGKAVATGLANEFNMLGNNKAGTPAENGAAALQKDRWDRYFTKFCDPDQNAGNIPCSATPYMNAHISPSKTIFAKETINLDDPDTMDAVSQLVFNISGYEVPDLIPTEVQRTAAGREQRQTNRENLAQMDAVGALVWSAIGERAVGEAAAEIKQTRVRAGISDAADKPSDREVRQKIVEELWDPNYYVQLGNAPGTIAQKEVYLKAYSLVLLYKMIEKTEKISNAFAIQSANMLVEAHQTDRDSASEVRPVR